MLFDHLFHFRISPRPMTAEKRGFCTCVTDRPSHRDARTHLKREIIVVSYQVIVMQL